MSYIFGPAKQDFVFVKGTTFLPGTPFTLRHKKTGVLVDLTGASASMTLRDHADGSLIIALTEISSPGLVLGGTLGTIKPNVSPAVTDTWTAEIMDYDLWVSNFDGGSDTQPFLCGLITLMTCPTSTQ